MQVLCQNLNWAHHSLADIKVPGPLNKAVDHKVEIPAEDLVKGLLVPGLGDTVPWQNQLSVGALEHWEDLSQSQWVTVE